MELDLSDSATKSDLKGKVGIDTFNLAANEDLSSIVTLVHKLDVDKIKTVTAHLSNLRIVVDINVVKNFV